MMDTRVSNFAIFFILGLGLKLIYSSLFVSRTALGPTMEPSLEPTPWKGDAWQKDGWEGDDHKPSEVFCFPFCVMPILFWIKLMNSFSSHKALEPTLEP